MPFSSISELANASLRRHGIDEQVTVSQAIAEVSRLLREEYGFSSDATPLCVRDGALVIKVTSSAAGVAIGRVREALLQSVTRHYPHAHITHISLVS